MILSLENIIFHLKNGFGIQKQRIYDSSNKWKKYKLLKTVNITLTNGTTIVIKEGFEWDLSSVPRFLWGILPPDGNFEIAALIHDYLYRKQLFGRTFADKEMLIWSQKLNGKKKISLRRLDNKIRFWGVRLFGRAAWKK